MSEKIKVWVARDGDRDGKNNKSLYMWMKKPEYGEDLLGDEMTWFWDNNGEYIELKISDYPEIKNGECYEAEIVLGEKI